MSLSHLFYFFAFSGRYFVGSLHLSGEMKNVSPLSPRSPARVLTREANQSWRERRRKSHPVYLTQKRSQVMAWDGPSMYTGRCRIIEATITGGASICEKCGGLFSSRNNRNSVAVFRPSLWPQNGAAECILVNLNRNQVNVLPSMLSKWRRETAHEKRMREKIKGERERRDSEWRGNLEVERSSWRHRFCDQFLQFSVFMSLLLARSWKGEKRLKLERKLDERQENMAQVREDPSRVMLKKWQQSFRPSAWPLSSVRCLAVRFLMTL